MLTFAKTIKDSAVVHFYNKGLLELCTFTKAIKGSGEEEGEITECESYLLIVRLSLRIYLSLHKRKTFNYIRITENALHFQRVMNRKPVRNIFSESY